MKRLVVGISGASGAIYGIRLLTVLQNMAGVETHLVLTGAARRTIHWKPISPSTVWRRWPIVSTVPLTSPRRYHRGRFARSA
jgi:hypothetical protein